MLTVARPQDPEVPPGVERRAILVAVRGRLSINTPLEQAARRARAANSPLTLVHAVPAPDSMPPGTCYADVVDAGRRTLQDEATRLSIDYPTVRVSTYLHCGDIVHALLGLSAGASLLVVGADRVNTLTGVFQGSVAIQAVLGSLASVLIVPTGPQSNSAKNGTAHGYVVVGVDGSTESSAALTRAAAEAHRLGAALRVIAAVKPASPAAEALRVDTSAMRSAIHAAYPSLRVSWIVDALRTPARALMRHSPDAALLVIGRHGRGTTAGMGIGSVTHTLLLRPPCPTLVITTPGPVSVVKSKTETALRARCTPSRSPDLMP
ncbi:universal stress protein [Arthrobacter agilis]|uniref:universal stress protein n=1 Tax=Arthrobacter agilis TaxID=37921 RepID=UPI002784B279|nr:universal stress protein [Arthrobacter agilis]MDQ0734697.1 nucleotide-binding universal stress UspA family protein [Arthrobacter agilis]